MNQRTRQAHSQQQQQKQINTRKETLLNQSGHESLQNFQKQRHDQRAQEKIFPISQNQILYFDEISTEPLLGFNILGEDTSNQVLQVSLYPKEKVYIRGKILYANFDWNKLLSNQFYGFDSFWVFVKEAFYTQLKPMRKIHNSAKHMGYFAFSKSKYGGKFLVIDSDVYDNIFIEKYLGPEEKLFTADSSIVCLSGTIKAKGGIGGLQPTHLEGPGWVFLENQSSGSIGLSITGRTGILLLIMLLFGLLEIMDIFAAL